MTSIDKNFAVSSKNHVYIYFSNHQIYYQKFILKIHLQIYEYAQTRVIHCRIICDHKKLEALTFSSIGDRFNKLLHKKGYFVAITVNEKDFYECYEIIS